MVDIIGNKGVNESNWAAYAAECANEQGRFWDYHDKLFDVWTGEFAGTYTKPKLKQYAAELKLDATSFNQCLDTDKTKPAIEADVAEAKRLGVYGTPMFFVNGALLQVQPPLSYGVFSRAFDSLLK